MGFHPVKYKHLFHCDVTVSMSSQLKIALNFQQWKISSLFFKHLITANKSVKSM